MDPSRRTLSPLVVVLGLALLPVPAPAQHVPVNLPGLRAAMSGNWFNPEQAGHGVQVEILDGGRAVLAWYTYTGDGTPLWLFGVGSVEGAVIQADLEVFTAGRPPGQWDEASPVAEPWGSVELEFTGCESGTLRWDSPDPDFGAGELAVQRLTNLQGLRCNAAELFSLQLEYSFERRMQNFTAVFADLPADFDPDLYELDYRREPLPPPLADYQGLRLTGHNRSDDLAMIVTAPVQGLLPEAYYRVELDVDLATNVPQGCAGVGGAPGESVYVKLGAAGVQPAAEADPADDWLRFNFDFGNQSSEGAQARVAGNLANSQDCEAGPDGQWELKTLSTRGQTLLVSTDAAGTLWVFAGTDSAFEGLTQYYLTALRVRLEPYETEDASH